MSLLSSKITARKKLSLKDAKIAPEERELPTAELVKDVERPPTDTAIAYTKLQEKNPVLDKLIDSFGLVDKETGERVKKVQESQNKTPQKEVKIKDKEEDRRPLKKAVETIKKPRQTKDNPKLLSLANKVLQEADSLSKEEIVFKLQEEANVNQERAEVGFNMMMEAEIIIQVNTLNRYYLNGSTPF